METTTGVYNGMPHPRDELLHKVQIRLETVEERGKHDDIQRIGKCEDSLFTDHSSI